MDKPNPNAACEHGHQRRKCPHCEILELEQENERLREALEKVRDEYAISHHDPSASLDLINDYATTALQGRKG